MTGQQTRAGETDDAAGAGFVSLHVGDTWAARCLHYPDQVPILTVTNGALHLTVSAAGENVTPDHIDFGYALLAAVNDYLIECERLCPPEGTGLGEPIAA